MSKADEMFEKQDYLKYEGHVKVGTLKYTDSKGHPIYFHLNEKRVWFETVVNAEVIKATYEKTKELGWVK